MDAFSTSRKFGQCAGFVWKRFSGELENVTTVPIAFHLSDCIIGLKFVEIL